MTTPNIVKGQIALDPTNDILYYVDESSTIVAVSLSWVKNNSDISTAEDVIISGDLTVSGSTVTVNVETLLIEDNIIVLNTGVTGTPSTNAGIEVERGTSTNVQIRWNESTDKWQLTNDGTNFYDILNSSGIVGDLTGNVTGNLTGNSAGIHTGAVVGNADTATKLLNARTISLTGPVTGSVSFDGTSNVSITTLLTAESSGITSLSDVTITSVASGDLLKYNGTAWVNTAGYATLASPTFTGTVSGITATMVGLGSVDNISDTAKPVSTAQQTAIDLKANIASPTFTGTVSGITATMVGLGSVDNTSDINKPVSTAGQTALNLKANLASPTFTGTVVLPSGTVASSDLAWNVYSAVGDLPVASTRHGMVAHVHGTGLMYYAHGGSWYVIAKADSPTFTGTVSGISATMIGLGSVDNTADTAKPVSTAQQTAIDLKANIASPTFTGNVNTSILFVDSIEVDTTGATSGQVLKYNGTKFAPAADNVATSGSLNITDLADVTVSSVSNGQVLKWSSSTSKWVNSADNAGTVINALDDIGDVTITSAATGDLLKWSGSAWINTAGYATLASPTFTGTPSAPTAAAATNTTQIATTAFVVSEIANNVYIPVVDDLDDLGDVTITSATSGDILKWNGTAWVNDSALLAAKANLASPTFTGIPAAPTAAASTNTTQVATTAFVRAEVAALVNSAGATLDTLGEIATALGNDAALSTTLTNSIALKAPLASPTFTGTVTLPANTVTSSMILDGTIANINISSSAAIDYSKLSLSNSITTTDLVSGAARGGFNSTLNAQTASYTLQATDLAKLVTIDSASNTTVTVPNVLSVGDRIDVLRKHATGEVTLVGDTGVTVNGTPGLKLRAQWSGATLVKLAANTWVVMGDLKA